jgi:hypothetical protein
MAVLTYQLVYFGWTKLESDEIMDKADGTFEISRRNTSYEDPVSRQTEGKRKKKKRRTPNLGLLDCGGSFRVRDYYANLVSIANIQRRFRNLKQRSRRTRNHKPQTRRAHEDEDDGAGRRLDLWRRSYEKALLNFVREGILQCTMQSGSLWFHHFSIISCHGEQPPPGEAFPRLSSKI